MASIFPTSSENTDTASMTAATAAETSNIHTARASSTGTTATSTTTEPVRAWREDSSAVGASQGASRPEHVNVTGADAKASSGTRSRQPHTASAAGRSDAGWSESKSNNDTGDSRRNAANAAGENTGDSGLSSFFDCSICLEHATDPVVTQCGHLYCWTCIFRWIQAGKNTCPVCKAGVTTDNVIPIYGKGDGQRTHPASSSAESPDSAIPQRPAGRRPEAPRNTFADFTSPNGPLFSTGMGYFPSLFGLHFQTYFGNPPVSPNLEQQSTLISRLFLVLGTLILVVVLFQ